MEFRILGPLEVSDGEAALPVAGATERALLVALILRVGRVVPADRLIDELWGEEPPLNARNALQARVSRLRKALRYPEVILTEPPGYKLAVGPQAVDASRFEVLVRQAREALEGGSTHAAELFDQALSLWRGPALADVADLPFAKPETDRLDELRLEATEDRLEALLATGRHGEVVGEAKALVAEHRWRERPRGQLMLALYRSGRQPDALQVFAETREALVVELGIDPSPELQRLHEGILRQDSALQAPERALRPRHELPARLTSFVGWEGETDELADLISARRLVTVTGAGGAGKTSLAVEASRSLLGRFSGGIVLVELAAITDPTAVALEVAEACGVGLEGPPLVSGFAEKRLVDFVRGVELLLVLDNCEHLADTCAELGYRLLRSSESLHLLTTSRKPLHVPGEVTWSVPQMALPEPSTPAEQLPDYDAIRLFAQRASDASRDFRLDVGTAPVVAEICRQLDGIPLAIELAAARVKTVPVDEVAARLGDRFRLLTGGSHTADARQQTLRATVEWSHLLLEEPERVLYRRLSVFRGGWSLEAAESICAGAGIDPPDVLDRLARLVDHSLVIANHVDGRFRMLETLRQHAGEQLAEAGELSLLTEAHAQYFANVIEGAEPELRGSDQGRWLTWLRLESDNVRAAVGWCRERMATESDLGLRLAAGLGWFSYFASRQEGRRELADMLAAAENASPAVRARALQAKALVARPAACVVHPSADCAAAARESLDLFTELDERHRAAFSKAFLAIEGISGADVSGSFELLAEADREFLRTSDEWGRGLVRFVRMELHFTAGAFDEAISEGEGALAIFRVLDDRWAVTAIPYHFGLALHHAGRLEAALRSYEDAVSEGRRVGRTNTVQYALANMGHVSLLLGDIERAEGHFGEANATAREIGADGNPLACLGQAALGRQRGDFAYARERNAEALRLLDAQEGEQDWTSAALAGLGSVPELTDELERLRAAHRIDPGPS
ncbi:MAG TPA: BTAD domain-containing putative transcriptional regulator [Thermoleophilaceae bacterium]|nr:BTAD domain-containing putative transcriptional regulator [Thermoleophilaceae bacterium]